MPQRMSSLDVDDLLRQIRDGLQHYPTWDGSVKIVFESEKGEELHVVKIDAHCSSPSAQRSRPPQPSSDASAGLDDQRLRLQQPQRLMQQCEEQRRRIAELEVRLLQTEEELRHPRSQPESDSVSADQLSPLQVSPTSTNNNHSTDRESPHLSSGGDVTRTTSIALTDGDDGDSLPRSDETCSTSPASSSPQRRSGRSKAKVDRWNPSTHSDAHHDSVGSGSSLNKRGTKRRRHHHDNDESIGMEVDDDGDDMEVAALVTKLREATTRDTASHSTPCVRSPFCRCDIVCCHLKTVMVESSLLRSARSSAPPRR